MKKDYTIIKKMSSTIESTVVGMDIYSPVITVATVPVNNNNIKKKR